VVTADRLPRPVGGTTSAVTVLDGAALRAAGVTHVLDALRTVPGAAIVRAGSPGAQTSLFLRGGESDYVRVLVDGVPQNDPGGAIDLTALTLDNVERIEVVRGPASVLYGSDAVAGVVQLFTRQAGAPTALHLAARAGSYGTRVGEGSLGLRRGRGGVTAALAHHATDGILAFNNAYRNTVASLAGDALLGGTRARLALRHGDNRFQYPTNGAGAVVDRNARRAERRLSSALDLSRAIGARMEAQLSLAALEVHGRTSDPTDGSGDTLGFFSYRAAGAVRRRVADLRVVARPNPAHTLAIGVEYANERQRSSDSSNYDVSLNRFSASRITRAAYAQWLADVGRLSLTVGGRYDDNDVFGHFRTARAGASIRLWQGGRARVAIGTSFKAPTFLEQFSTAFSVGNPALVPERSRSWEGGVDQELAGGRARLSVTAFDQRFRDLIQYAWRGPSDPNYFNVAAASSRGLEAEGRVSAARGVELWATATALRTRVDDAGLQSGAGATFVQGERLLRRAPFTWSAGLQLQRLARTRLDVAFTRVGERDDRDFSAFPANPVVLAAYSRLDVGGEYAVAQGDGMWGATALTLRVENALGAGYEEIANFRAPGRLVLAGVRVGKGR
jgi:vitamin B12 transporter